MELESVNRLVGIGDIVHHKFAIRVSCSKISIVCKQFIETSLQKLHRRANDPLTMRSVSQTHHRTVNKNHSNLGCLSPALEIVFSLVLALFKVGTIALPLRLRSLDSL